MSAQRHEENEITRVIQWLLMHPSYISTGYALAEYVSKSAFVHEELETLLGRIKNLAEMPPLTSMPDLTGVLTKTDPSQHQIIALRVFRGNPWYEIGASCRAITQRELHESYERWRLWGQRHWPLLAQLFAV